MIGLGQTVPLNQVKKPSRSSVGQVERFEQAGYRVVGRHSAVKVCHWTKSALRGGKLCYKSWYGIDSHRCIQMTPSVQYCNMMCVFCWRFHTLNRVQPFDGEWDNPQEILDKVVEEHRQLLSGFGGNPKVSRQRFMEAMEPKHIAISLDGEPTLYPYLPELIAEATRRGMTTFLVSNGTMPEKLEELLNKAQPTSLYISLYGPDKETHFKASKPLVADSWERLLRSLELMKRFSCRKVIRLTLVKEVNMHSPEKYAQLIKVASPDFVECKGYTHVGESQKRLKRENMPTIQDIREFAEELRGLLRFSKVVEDDVSRVVLLADASSPWYKQVASRLLSV
ncbi:MAG: 4-demethylwyosine synthase TYW1 [Candidatus Caldarchaeum sp.]|nr:4-demethylwyosine synthase TYW1 [Candidatus Caldarchaeum sp.]